MSSSQFDTAVLWTLFAIAALIVTSFIEVRIHAYRRAKLLRNYQIPAPVARATRRCDVCGAARPIELVSVYEPDISDPEEQMLGRVYYCSDDLDCIAQAAAISRENRLMQRMLP